MTFANCPKCGSSNVTTAGVCANCGWTRFPQVMGAGESEEAVYELVGEIGIKVTGKALLDDYKRLLFENNSLTVRIAELEAAQRWIPVSERLPDKNDTVLVFGANESDSSPAIAVFYDCNWTEWIVNSRFLKSSDVTHWMPLPEYPNDTQTDTFVYGKDSKPIPCPFCGEIMRSVRDE